MFSIMILFVRLFMFSVTSWLRCHPWAERPQNPGNWNLYRTARQRLTLLWMSAVHRAPSLLSMLGSFRLCNYPDLCFEGILLVWHNKVPLKWEGGGTWGSGWKSRWVQRAPTNVTTFHRKQKTWVFWLCLLWNKYTSYIFGQANNTLPS